MSGRGKLKAKTSRGASASASQNIHASEEEEVTATMLRDIIQSLKANICNSIKAAVKGFQIDVAAVKSELCTTTGALQQTINLQEERLATVEDSAMKTRDSLAEMEATVGALKGESRSLQNKCEDLENRSRRNNLRIVGIAEGEQGKTPDSIYLQPPKRPVESGRATIYRPSSSIIPS